MVAWTDGKHGGREESGGEKRKEGDEGKMHAPTRRLETAFISPFPSPPFSRLAGLETSLISQLSYSLILPPLPSSSPLSPHPPRSSLILPALPSSSPLSPHSSRSPLILPALPSSSLLSPHPPPLPSSPSLSPHLPRSPLIFPALPSFPLSPFIQPAPPSYHCRALLFSFFTPTLY
ncbi:unnamed protein product [Closterium sp. Naga37s-1]|nr:unnamed protein product [Closterium sp. Naga37s-1]